MESRVSAASGADTSGKADLKEKRVRDSCQDFSGIMISYMMKTMREGYSGGDEPSLASGVYQDMLYEQVSKVIAHSGTLGLGDSLYSQLGRMEKKDGAGKQPGAAVEAQKTVSSQISLNKSKKSAE
ncbi:MAG: rod-binding protein [Syntrophobacteraceae bacterium]|nr:rod-binding protein [Syntrophobacteraceae bacterium]